MSIPVKSPQPLASVILINGFPGVGKLTIARALQKKIGANARLIDNNLLIDPWRQLSQVGILRIINLAKHSDTLHLRESKLSKKRKLPSSDLVLSCYSK